MSTFNSPGSPVGVYQKVDSGLQAISALASVCDILLVVRVFLIMGHIEK